MSESLDIGPRAGCRAGRPTPAQDSSLMLIVAFVVFVLGYFATDRFIHTRSVAAEFTPVSEEFGLWTSVLGTVGAFAVASLVYFVAAGIGVGRLFTRLRRRTVALAVVVAVAPLTGIFAALILGSTSVPESVDKRLAEATRPFVLTAGACTVPGLVGLLLIRAIARRDSEWREGGACSVALVLRLRSELRRLLGVLGAFLTLLVIATGLRRRAVLALAPQTHLPAVSVVLYGFVFAVLLGAFYAAAGSAVDGRASRLVEGWAALPEPDAPDLVQVIGRRGALNSLVGLDGGTWRTFQNVVVVAAPLLTALIGSAVGGS